MCVIVNNEKRGQEFERELVGVYERFWREKKEWINDVIIIAKKKRKNLKKSGGYCPQLLARKNGFRIGLQVCTALTCAFNHRLWCLLIPRLLEDVSG